MGIFAMRPSVAALAIAALLGLAPTSAAAHWERQVHEPDGRGSVPVYRTTGPTELVCGTDFSEFMRRIAGYSGELMMKNLGLFDECRARGHRYLQEAIDAAPDGARILMLPGVYSEEASLAPLSEECLHLKTPIAVTGFPLLSHEQQKQCPHLENLVGIFDRRNLQIEGTGAAPSDVVLDGKWQKLEILRADRANGIYLRNFQVQKANDNAIYILETDGFVIDHVLSRWNDSYGFLSFATDHGLYTDCEAYGNGDSGIYPGGTSDINHNRGFDVPRYAVEVRNCHSHDNVVGYSGTGGDSVWVHDSEFDRNTIGASMDSAFPNHPGLPQNHAKLERNRIHNNNANFYASIRDGTCKRPYADRGLDEGKLCPTVGPPIGTGVIIAGGNYNLFRDNWVYDNWRVGFILLWVPGFVRGDLSLGTQFDNSFNNRFSANHMGVSPAGGAAPNGLDYWWDGVGSGNCWGDGSADPPGIPRCGAFGPTLGVPDVGKLAYNFNCSNYSRMDSYLPPGCDWFNDPPRPGTVTWDARWLTPIEALIVAYILFSRIRRRARRRDG